MSLKTFAISLMQVRPVRLWTLFKKVPQWSLLPHQHLQSPPLLLRHWAARALCQLVQPPPIRRCLWTSQNRWGVRISLDTTELWNFDCCCSALALFQMVNQGFALIGLWTALQYMKLVMAPTCGLWLVIVTVTHSGQKWEMSTWVFPDFICHKALVKHVFESHS